MKTKTKPSKILSVALLFAGAFAGSRALAQTSATPVILTSTNVNITLNAANDWYQIAPGATINGPGIALNAGARSTPWYIINSGIVVGATNGLTLGNSTMYFTNTTGALIQGNGSANNAGIYFNSSATGTAVITNSGTVQGVTSGIYLNGAGNIITNNAAGSIIGTGSNGVYFAASALNNLLDNAGIVSGYTTGVYFTSSGSVVNRATGLISGLGNVTSQGGIQFATAAAGNVENSGTILGGMRGITYNNTAGANVLVNNTGGLIQSQSNSTSTNYTAIFTNTNVALGIDNAGAIIGINYAIVIQGSSTIVNTGTITGVNNTALQFAASGTNACVSNAGIIHGANSGVYYTAGGTLINLAGGLVQGDSSVSTQAGVYFASAAPGNVENSGTIIGGMKAIVFSGAAPATDANALVNHANALIQTQDAGTSTNYAAVYLGAGADPLNLGNEGSILGAGSALLIASTATITNTGTIIGSGLYGAWLTTAGAGEINNSGILIGGSSGIYSSANVTIRNLAGGFISGSGATSSDAGIYFTNSATDVRVENSGTILGEAQGIHFGAAGNSLLINNAGALIQSQSDGANVNYSAVFTASNTVTDITNAGSISGAYDGIMYYGSGSLVNTGTITGGGDSGVRLGASSAGVSVDNTGAISGTSSGVYFAASGTLINRATGVISGSSDALASAGVYFSSGAADAHVENSGTISGGAKGINYNNTSGNNVLINNAGALIEATINTGAGYGAIYTGAGAPLTITNAGIIHGADYALALGGATTLENTGAIIGGTADNGAAIALLATAPTAASALALNDGSQITGDIVSAAANLNTITLAGNGAITGNIIGNAGDATLGISTLAMNGSTWLVSGTVQLTAPAPDALNIATGHLTILNDLILADPAGGVTIAPSATLQIGDNTPVGGIINLSLSTGPAIANNGLLIISPSDDLAFTGALTGSGDLVKAGAGTLDLTAANLAATTGNTTILAGNLVATAATAVGSTGTITLANSATITFEQTTAAGDAAFANLITGDGNLVKNGSALLDLTNTAAGGNNYTGATTVNSGTLKGSIGSGALTVNAGATYKVADAVTDFTISGILGAGTVDLNTANLTFNVPAGVSDTFAFTGALAGGNQLIKTGAGSLDLQTPAVLANGVAVKNGTLLLNNLSLIGAPVTLGDTADPAATGLINYTGAATWDNPITLVGAGGGFTVDAAATQTLTPAATIAGAGDFIKTGAGTLDITAATMNNTGNTAILGGTLIATAATAKGAITLANNSTITFDQTTAAGDATITDLITGDGNLVKNGSALLNLANTVAGGNNYTGATTVNSGTLQGSIGQGTLTVNAGATYKVADGITNFSISGILGAGTIDLNASSLTFNVAAGVSDTFAFTGALTSSNPVSVLTKTGAGTLVLQSAATLSGGADIEQGTLSLADQTLINAPVILGTATTYALIAYTAPAAAATPWALDITLNGSPTTATLTGGGFTVADPAATQPLAITVNGAGAFIKDGPGVLDITAATMNNTGNTAILGGTLIATAVTAKGDITLANNATITFDQTTDATITNSITGAGNLVKNGSALLDLANTANNYTGDTTINAGTLQGAIGAGTLTVNAGATYKVADGVTDFSLAGILGAGTIDLNAADLTFNVATGTSVFNFTGALAGGNQLIKTGAGALALQTPAALTNGVAIKNGALLLDNLSLINTPVTLGDAADPAATGLIAYTGAAPWNKNLSLTGAGGGFTVDNAATTLQLAPATTVTGAADFIKTGAGALDITAATMNNTGNTRIDAGTLIVTAATAKGNITLANNSTITFAQTTAAGGAGDATFAGAITGAGNLIKNGDALLNLTNTANNYTGDTTINAGTLKGAIGAGALTVNTGATYIVADGVSDFSLTNVTGAGTINLNTANLTLNADAGATTIFNFTGQLAGGNQLIKTGAGTLELQTPVPLANGAQIQNGTLLLNNLSLINAPVTLGSASTQAFIDYTGAPAWNKNLTLAGAGGGFTVTDPAATLQLAPATTVTGAADFIKTGAGALDITAATMNNTGNTTILDGTLIATAATAKGNITLANNSTITFAQTTAAGGAGDATITGLITGDGNLIKTGDALLNLANTANNYTGATTINAGTLKGSIGTGPLTVNTGATYIVPDGVTDFSLAGILGAGTINLNTANLTLNADAGTTTIFAFTGQLAGGNQLIKTGAGTLELQTPVALTNGAQIQNGTLLLNNLSLLNAPVTLGSAAAQAFIDYTGAPAWNKNLTLAGAGGGFTVDPGATTQLAATITGVADFIKAGEGTLDITAATMNNTGNTQVQNGALIATASQLAGAITLAAPTSTLEIVAGASSSQAGEQDAPPTLTGAITGSGKLIKTGAGTLTLASPANNYTGGTELREGSLAGSAATLQGDISTAANTTIIFNQTTDTGNATYAGVISGAGALEKTGAGKLTLTGAYADAIPVTVTAGALQGNASNLRGNITLAAATAAIVFDQTTDATYAGIITGAGSFEKTGAGALTLTAAQTYAGDTRVTAGTLRPAASNLLSPASAITLAGGTLDIGKTTQQARGLTGGAGTLGITAAFNPNTGLITDTGKLTLAGGVANTINLHITFDSSFDAGGSQSALLIDTPNPAAAAYNVTYDNRAVLGNRDLVFSPDIGMLVPQYSPEILSAVVLPSLARLMGKAGIDTLQQRLGDLRRQRTPGVAYTVRGIYREDDLGGPLFGSLKIRTAGAQAAASWIVPNILDPKQGRLDMGLLVTAVQADANYRNQADIDATSREGGVYATLMRGPWYADLLANIARNTYNVRLRDGSGTLNCTGLSPSLSFETGWSFDLGRDFGSIEPQGQVIYQHHQINHSVDLFDRAYNFASTDSLVTRASLLWHVMLQPSGGTWTIVPYARASIGREFRGNQKLVVDDEPFTNDLRGVETTFEGGLTVRISNQVSIYGSAAWSRGNNVSSTYITGGLRLSW